MSCRERALSSVYLTPYSATVPGSFSATVAFSSGTWHTNDALAFGGCIINRSSAREASDQDRTGAPRPAAHALAAAPAATSIRYSSLVSVRPALTRRHRQPDPEQHAPRTTRLQRSLTPHAPRRSLLLHDTARPSSTPGVRFPLRGLESQRWKAAPVGARLQQRVALCRPASVE
eukprot:scaffold30518_cov67-Phaeocystis_antarctica.AAC.6